MAALLEFVVKGTPVSAQGGAQNLRKWKRKVREQARLHWKKSPMKQRLSSTMIHFHKGDEAPLDNDNMSKPVHDAMEKVIYEDDRQVIHTKAIQVGLDLPIALRGPSQLLLDSIGQGEDFVYIRVEEIPEAIVFTD